MNSKENTNSALQVVTNNDFIKRRVPDLTSNENNLLVGLLSNAKRKETDLIEIDLNYAAELAGVDRTYIKKLSWSMWDKVKKVDYRYESNAHSGNNIDAEVILFTMFSIDNDEDILTFGINPHLAYFVNYFERGSYTSFPHESFKSIEDGYSKRLYMLLSQFNSTGFVHIKTDDIKEFIGCPKSYSNSDFLKIIIYPGVEEMNKYFKDLTLEKVRKGRGGKLHSLKFTFKPQKVSPEWDEGFKKQKAKEKKTGIREVNPAKINKANSGHPLTNANDEYTFEQCVEMGIEYIPGMSNEDFLEYNR